MVDLEEIIEFIEHPIPAIAIGTILLAISLKFFPDIAKDVIIMIIAFFVSDIICRFTIGGGNGIFQNRLNDNLAVPKGHAFFIFSGIIIGSTIEGERGADWAFTNIIIPNAGSITGDLIVAGSFAIAIFICLWTRYYEKDD